MTICYGAIMVKFLLLLIRLYQLTVGPFIGKSCRFYPSCSDYAMEALRKYGTWKGIWLTLCRVGRCGPWNPGGVDLP